MVACSLLIAAGLAAVSPGPADAKGGNGGTSTDSALLRQAENLAPLRALADAIGTQGRGSYADTYSNIRIDEANDQVSIYVTSLERGRQMVNAAAASSPALELSKIVLVKAQFTKRLLDERMAKVMTPSYQRMYDINSVAAAPDGSGLQATTTSSTADLGTPAGRNWLAAASSALTTAAGLSVAVSPGTPIEAATWRWNDTYPLIGGDVILGPSHRSGYREQCTTGLAVEDSSGTDFVTAADHCFPGSVSTYGEGDSVGKFWLYLRPLLWVSRRHLGLLGHRTCQHGPLQRLRHQFRRGRPAKRPLVFSQFGGVFLQRRWRVPRWRALILQRSRRPLRYQGNQR